MPIKYLIGAKPLKQSMPRLSSGNIDVKFDVIINLVRVTIMVFHLILREARSVDPYCTRHNKKKEEKEDKKGGKIIAPISCDVAARYGNEKRDQRIRFVRMCSFTRRSTVCLLHFNVT